MLVKTRPSPILPKDHQTVSLETVAVGLGTVQLLLDLGRSKDARATLRVVRKELQTLRRSATKRDS